MANMSKYIRVTQQVGYRGYLIPKSNKLPSQRYSSVFYYNEEQYALYKDKQSIEGITDVFTDKIYFDFDEAEDTELARQDAITLVSRLKSTNKIKDKHIKIYFSGGKGYHVEVDINTNLSPKQVGDIALRKFGKDLKTLDKKIYNASRILRVPGTVHETTGLYKIPLTIEELSSLTIDLTKEKAKTRRPEFTSEVFEADEEFLKVEEKKEEVVKKSEYKFDVHNKDPRWRNCKWSLLQGNIPRGDRHHALMTLAATCRGLGYNKEMAFDLTSGALKRSIAIYGQGTTTEDYLQDNIIEEVFSESWKGGQYSCKTDDFLKDYCEKLGEHACKDENTEENHILGVEDVFKDFENFAGDFEKNILKTGIKELDENVMFLTSTHNGILGQPGSGKTSFIIQWLKNLSNNNQLSLFYSLDMAKPIICAKLIQTVTGYDFKKALSIVKDDNKKYQEIYNKIKEQYKNVKMIFRSASSVEMIKNDIKSFESETGKKVSMVAIDYLECMAGPFADATANTGFISNQMKDLASEMKVCSVMLLQTQKHSTGGDVSAPLMSMKQVKGSSIIEQSTTVVLTMWREGYHPKFQEHDRYISLAAVKYRFGPLWMNDFRWDGSKGFIGGNLGEEEIEQLNELRNMKKEEKAKQHDDWN